MNNHNKEFYTSVNHHYWLTDLLNEIDKYMKEYGLCPHCHDFAKPPHHIEYKQVFDHVWTIVSCPKIISGWYLMSSTDKVFSEDYDG